MTNEEKEKWTAALRSGEYRQAHRQLRTSDAAVCCLGLKLLVVDGIEAPDLGTNDDDPLMNGALYSRVTQDLAVSDLSVERLMRMNDDGRPFAAIADYIDEHFEDEGPRSVPGQETE